MNDQQKNTVSYGEDGEIIPEVLRNSVLDLLHRAHFGVVKTKILARSAVWWPKLDDDIECMVKSCDICQANRGAKNEQLFF